MIESTIDNVFGEYGCLPNMPVEFNGVILFRDIYCIVLESPITRRREYLISGWINAHHIKNNAPAI